MKKFLAASALVVLALAGCSKTDNTTTAGGSTGSSAAPTTATAGSSKASVIEAADKICVDSKAAQNKIETPKSASDVKDYLQKVVDLQKESIKKIKALGPPAEDADKFNTAVSKAEKVIEMFESKLDEIAKDPTIVDSDSEMKKTSDEADKAAQDFGFKECGKSDSLSGGDKTSTTKKGSSSTTTASDSGSGSGGGALSLEKCVDVASANLDLVTASSKDAAETAGKKLMAFNPPADVSDAIEKIVSNGGPDYTDSKTAGYIDSLNNWIKQICPNLAK